MRRSARRAIAAAGTLLVALAGCSGSSSKHATAPAATFSTTTTRPVERRFTVSPTQLMVGAPVTFSGSGCPPNDVVEVNLFAGAGSSDTLSGTSAEVTPDASGSWTATTTVGNSTVLGKQRVTAVCVTGAKTRPVFTYPMAAVNVATFRSLQVAPATTVAPGATLVVTPLGGCAPPAISSPDLTLGLPAGSSRTFQELYGTIARGPGGDWTGRVAIPQSTPPGTYSLFAYCLASRAFTTFYPTVAITVLPKA